MEVQEMNAVERVKAICKERKIPISKLESDCGFANGYIGQLRKGVFPDDRILKISEYLNVSVDYLMTGTEKTYSEEDALLDAHISEDVELKEAIKKYYTLDEKARKYILEGIDLLWRANKTDTK
jgi:transcriptional regulator with XRE-family HTH domain